MGDHHRIAASSLSASALLVACNAMLDIKEGSLGENGGTSGAAGVAAQAGFDLEAGRYGSGGTTQSGTYGSGVAGDSSQGSGADLRWSGRENPFQNPGYDDVMWVPSELALWDDTCYVARKTNSDPIFG